VLSDGLPNVGAGLPPDDAKKMSEFHAVGNPRSVCAQMLKTDWNKAVAGRRVRINTIGFFIKAPMYGAFLWGAGPRENDGSFVGMSKP